MKKSSKDAEKSAPSSGKKEETGAARGGDDLEDLLDRELDLEEYRERKKVQKLERLWAMQRRNNQEGVGKFFKDKAKKSKPPPPRHRTRRRPDCRLPFNRWILTTDLGV